MKRKILDVVLECMDKGIESKPVLEKLRSEGNLIEPKRKPFSKIEEEYTENKNNELSPSEWARHEENYYNNKF